MAFDGTEGTYITLEEGSALTSHYRNVFLTGNRQRKGVFFGKDKLLAILNQTECVGIRCYFGAVDVTNSGGPATEISLVLVGAGADENDQLSAMDKILDYGVPCPTKCGSTNSLNS